MITEICFGGNIPRRLGYAKNGKSGNNTFISGHPAAVKIVGILSPASYSISGLGWDESMTLLSQFGGKTYHIDYYGTPEAYNTFLPTAQQIIDSFNATGR